MTLPKKGLTISPEGKPVEPEIVRGGLLQPAASMESLVESFKRYVALKDALLEDADYVWSVAYRVGSEESRKFFSRREEAEAFIKEMSGKGVVCHLEKKVRKSGCLKLGKAFAISTEILDQSEAADGFYFCVRAYAPNGQSQERTGRCDRKEKGRAGSPMDSIEATAMTRATNRAIMALLGGETTAEEVEEDQKVQEPQPATPAVSHPLGVTPGAAVQDREKLMGDLDKQFGGAKPALDQKLIMTRKMFAMAKEAGMAADTLKDFCRATFKVTSSKDLSIEQIGVVLTMLDGTIKRMKGR